MPAIADHVRRACEMAWFIEGADEAKTADLSAGPAAKFHRKILEFRGS
jgi:hypothetical protein